MNGTTEAPGSQPMSDEAIDEKVVDAIKAEWVKCRGDHDIVEDAHANGVTDRDGELRDFAKRQVAQWKAEAETRRRAAAEQERGQIEQRINDMQLGWNIGASAVLIERALDRLTVQVKRLADLVDSQNHY